MSMNTEEYTLSQALPSTGYQVPFTDVRGLVNVTINGGEFWIRARFSPSTPGTVPTNPVPAAGTVVGWTRMVSGGPVVQYGDATSIRTGYGPKITFIDVWCVSQGDLMVLAQ